jgi:hypothetical protein
MSKITVTLLALTICFGFAASQSLNIAINGLEPLGDDFLYEHWLIVDDSPVSAGRFQVQSASTPYSAELSIDEASLGATTYVLTIEPQPDADPLPAATHVIAGDFGASGSATLTVSNPFALGNSFAAASGQFILAAPTGAADEPHEHGIWWLVPGATPSAGLVLPTLPPGWQYEGWVASASGPVSTGTFLSASGADSDGAGATAGPNTASAPGYPGQDFVTPAPVNLTDGYTAVISVEPVPDNSASPFSFKPLVKEIANVAPPTTQAMDSNLASFATGLAILNEHSSATQLVATIALCLSLSLAIIL